MDGFFNLSTNSILTNMRAKVVPFFNHALHLILAHFYMRYLPVPYIQESITLVTAFDGEFPLFAQ